MRVAKKNVWAQWPPPMAVVFSAASMISNHLPWWGGGGVQSRTRMRGWSEGGVEGGGRGKRREEGKREKEEGKKRSRDIKWAMQNLQGHFGDEEEDEVRFVSVGGEGFVYIWVSHVIGNIFEAYQPTSKLEFSITHLPLLTLTFDLASYSLTTISSLTPFAYSLRSTKNFSATYVFCLTYNF